MKMMRLVVNMAAATAGLAAGHAMAAGFALQNQNGAGTGYAYAGSAAVAEDASTIFFNPAGMLYLSEGHHVTGALPEIELAREIGTYETSILPYEDCCTIFSPKSPVIKPDRQVLQQSYRGLEIDELLETAAANTERIYIPPREGVLPEKEYL